MIARYRIVARRILRELDDLERTVTLAQRDWDYAQKDSAYHDALLNSVALNLHSYYTGLERLFEVIGQEIDGSLPRSADWHAALLKQMVFDLSPMRPPVIDESLLHPLDELRRFRHRVRNLYGFALDAERMQGLLEELPDTWARTRVRLEGFARYLDSLSDSDS